MDPELQARLITIEKKLDETLRVVSSMRRAQRTSAVMRWLYWIVIIGLAIFSLQMIRPYLTQLGEMYGGLFGASQKDGQKGTDYSEILNQLKEFQSNQ